MNAPERELQEHREDSKGTLGDILYADKSRTVVSEADWLVLVDAIAAGDRRALHALYEWMHQIVFTLIIRITKNRETAEELMLDVFHDVWRRAADYDAANGSVAAWIMNQARSRALDRQRLEQPQQRAHPHRELLQNALGTLTQHERQVIETAFLSELTYAEVAARLNEPPEIVKSRMCSGLEKLRHTLNGVGS